MKRDHTEQFENCKRDVWRVAFNDAVRVLLPQGCRAALKSRISVRLFSMCGRRRS